METTTLLTLEQFLALPEDDCRHELDEGVLIVSPPPSGSHGDIALSIGSVLRMKLSGNREFKVISEAGFILTEKPYTVRAPDVAVLKRSRMDRGESPYFKGA